MTILHSAPNGFEVHNLKNVLESSGIHCEVRGEFRKPGGGELPLNECWVELWLLDDGQLEDARRVLAEPSATSAAEWVCKRCNETVEGQFDRCWNCGREDEA